jgi:hypothetical protein
MWGYIILLVIVFAVVAIGDFDKHEEKALRKKGCTCKFTWLTWTVSSTCKVHEYVYKNM